ncbi:NADPH:quinone reductase [Amycolatopsis acidiphila]|uniref:NADPH:quinone reductase n=1 Tax=Amycolatopsis acidiphila TaxID=715473 RepID=A0A558ADK4_9PSEU|nr:NADPH:quinone reductase [Amycolatopsis acidiphila]TVT22303.1 NADPH:quinone reductase [Amycolatopsis acidiphila]UIJ57982.1 NADPH:quinone reductase [Amycolatopsis acidiphila]GHG70721.1 NADPH:quinone reductase [Amycolatopsis acidiphila]
MKAIVYSQTGGPEVLRLTERPVPEPGPGEVRVQVKVSGVNPTDWKSRQGATTGGKMPFPEIVPNQDGAGIVDAVGPGVTGLEPGQRVWLWESAWQRPDGTAQEYVALPADHVVPLPGEASFDLGATLGVPALTAHRALTVAEGGPARLAPGALDGRAVLVAGGAGAVGHAAIELARWAGAEVVTTVSSDEKAALAQAAGAQHIVNYRAENAAEAIRKIFPDGVDVVVEVAPAVNAKLNEAVLASNGTVAVYANNGGEEMTVTIRSHMTVNARYQFLLLYTVPKAAKAQAIEDVNAAVAAGALRVGEEAGMPLHRFPLERTADAHAAVESGVVGKVLIDVG